MPPLSVIYAFIDLLTEMCAVGLPTFEEACEDRILFCVDMAIFMHLLLDFCCSMVDMANFMHLLLKNDI